MSFDAIYNITGSAMTAQTIRLNIIASNLANANVVASSAEEAYKTRSPIFATFYPINKKMSRKENRLNGAGVAIVDIVETGEAERRYMPNHPLADPQGYVFYSNVNVIDQMTDMKSTSSSFAVSMAVFNATKKMQMNMLKLGENN